MKTPNRDLLVLVKDEHYTREAMESELEQLNRLLLNFETTENICSAHEVYDLNRYKIIQKPALLQRIMNDTEIKPFVFICNRN